MPRPRKKNLEKDFGQIGYAYSTPCGDFIRTDNLDQARRLCENEVDAQGDVDSSDPGVVYALVPLVEYDKIAQITSNEL